MMATNRIDLSELGTFGEGDITMQVLSRGDMERFMPSNVLVQNRVDPLLRSFLFKCGDDVIQHDYKGIIDRGIIRGASVSMQDVLEVLSAWYIRMETNVRDEFEKELLSQVEGGGVDDDVQEGIIRNFPAVKHDMIRLELNSKHNIWGMLADDGVNRQYYHGPYKDRLIAEYDFTDKEDPSLSFVILRSFLKSIEMSKHVDERLTKHQLDAIYEWLYELKKDDPDSFRRDKAALLLELLQNAKLDTSQLLETSEPLRVEINICRVPYIIGGSGFNTMHPWRCILEELCEGANQQNEYRQHPLQVLLINGLPGQDILVSTDPKSVETRCPEENLYPFQLAATKKEYGVNVSEETLWNLDREQLSQIYSLMRAMPEQVYNSL
jgi:hypothetical protein